METLLGSDGPPLAEMSPLTLAFLGDGVYELLAREYLVGRGNCPVKRLHGRAVELVRCEAQARALRDALWPLLTEEEQAVALRGRNAHVGHVPKNAQVGDYHGATALEALFGWLYLQGKLPRLRELFSQVIALEEREGLWVRKEK